MPPSTPPPTLPQRPLDTEHMLPPHQKKSAVGPMVGTIIILILLGFGALYFWGASMNREQDQLPLIPADDSTLNSE